MSGAALRCPDAGAVGTCVASYVDVRPYAKERMRPVSLTCIIESQQARVTQFDNGTKRNTEKI